MKEPNYWRIFMHPTGEHEYDKHIYHILENERFIGLGHWAEGESQVMRFRDEMEVGDIVVVCKSLNDGSRNGIVALVEVVGESYYVPTKDNPDKRTNWIENRRRIRVLDWNIYKYKDMDYLPSGQITLANVDKHLDFVKGWHQATIEVLEKRGVSYDT